MTRVSLERQNYWGWSEDRKPAVFVALSTWWLCRENQVFPGWMYSSWRGCGVLSKVPEKEKEVVGGRNALLVRTKRQTAIGNVPTTWVTWSFAE